MTEIIPAFRGRTLVGAGQRDRPTAHLIKFLAIYPGGAVAGRYDRKDRLYQQAKEEGYRSRAAYKLLELDAKLRILRAGAKVVDLGSFPGGWLQVAKKAVGPKGIVIGVDLRPLEPFSPEETAGRGLPIVIEGDIGDPNVREAMLAHLGGKADVVLSDMSPRLTGIRFGDVARSAEVVELALAFAEDALRPGGTFIAKIFPGNETDLLVRAAKKSFESLGRQVLKSTRQTSTEIYVVGRGFRPAPQAELPPPGR